MEDKVLEHEHDFDGIVELDNDLPRWWLGIFWVTMAVAVIYVPYYHFINPDKLPQAAYEADVAAAAAARAEAEAAKPVVEDEEAALWARYEAGGWQEAAKTDFNTLCMPCHAPDGGGTIGPNFTDDYYIHGGTLENIRHIINEGVPAKGMVPWKLTLKPDQIERLTFYIRALRGTTPAVAKAPEGKLVDEKGNFIEDGSGGDEPAEPEAAPADESQQ